MENHNNIILTTDSYKMTHWKMIPPKTQYMFSYFEARAGGEYHETVFFGLQYLLEKYLRGSVVSSIDITEADDFCRSHFGQELFNKEGWEYIRDEHEGRLPISIQAVPEGKVVPESNVLLTIENTDPNCAWLVNHLETLLVQLWYPCTVATISRAQKHVLRRALNRSGSLAKLPFMLHDFGFRGSTSVESASIGGAAHLVNFMGTDTIAGADMLMKYYDADMPGFSVPAAEHSTITAWGKHGELDAYTHILNQYPEGLVSVVSDSWNIYEACEKHWGGALREEIANNPGRTVVVRPDSGDPERVVPRCLNILGDAFGFTVNDKGYRVLPDYIRLIQGDGISRKTLPGLLDAIMAEGWSLDNIVFGSGGGLLQDCNRDTLRFALKCSWVVVDGKERPVYKQPASDPTKNSKRGRLKLVEKINSRQNRVTGEIEDWREIITVPEDDTRENVLQEVFYNGRILKSYNLDEVRKNVRF